MRVRSKSILHEFQSSAGTDEPLQAALFHEHSKLTPYRRAEVGQRIAQLQSGGLVTRMTEAFKCYPALPQIALPRAILELQRPLQDIIAGRRSATRFDTSQPTTLQALATILQLSYGITGHKQLGSGVTQYVRAIPSGGALYPLELYVMVSRVEGLEPGLYHYRVAHHALEQLDAGDDDLQRIAADGAMMASAAFHLIIAAVFARSLVKYRDRGYRFVLMEAGGLATQAGLVAECQGVHTCLLGGFLDDEMNRLCGLDGVDEAVVLCAAFGQ